MPVIIMTVYKYLINLIVIEIKKKLLRANFEITASCGETFTHIYYNKRREETIKCDGSFLCIKCNEKKTIVL